LAGFLLCINCDRNLFANPEQKVTAAGFQTLTTEPVGRGMLEVTLYRACMHRLRFIGRIRLLKNMFMDGAATL
jgi:hypothetical protein